MNSSTEKKPADPEELTDLAEFEQGFSGHSPIIWWISFLGPWVTGILFLVACYSVYGPAGLQNLAMAITATFLALGRFVILFGSDEEPIVFTESIQFTMTSESLFVMLTIMDFLVAFFVAFHMDVLFRVPLFGPKLAGMVSDGRFILKHQPWIRNVAFLGLVLFVIFPSSTTGSIGGSIFGRLLGMKRARVVTAILVGSVLGNGLMYALSSWIEKIGITNDNIWLKLGGVIGMIVILVFTERYYRSLKQKYMAKEEAEREAMGRETVDGETRESNDEDDDKKS